MTQSSFFKCSSIANRIVMQLSSFVKYCEILLHERFCRAFLIWLRDYYNASFNWWQVARSPQQTWFARGSWHIWKVDSIDNLLYQKSNVQDCSIDLCIFIKISLNINITFFWRTLNQHLIFKKNSINDICFSVVVKHKTQVYIMQ